MISEEILTVGDGAAKFKINLLILLTYIIYNLLK